MNKSNIEGKKILKKEILEWIKAIIIAVVLVILVRWLLFSPFVVDGPSMEPTLWTGERVIVNKLIYNLSKPAPGDVIVFHEPKEDKDLIKRVIGVAGDTIEYKGDNLIVNGNRVDEAYISEAISTAHNKGELYNNNDFPNDIVTVNKVPEGYIFVMGDHRNNSKDSRGLGFIPLEDVIGRAELIFWPLNKISISPFQYSL
ncbi:signal peptidase I [Paenibacillus alvei]|uniref:Signal peptidase I n=1 Tax=Paenibacillus alvei TaxID=44250 RepID=A0AAP7A521_PAEAL|nr:signal peptidase I [Paenibacillus alvei]NOJ73108.1 signal peptidase I [Paenibacillus alvei]